MAEVAKAKFTITNVAALESRIGKIQLYTKSGEKESADDTVKSVQHIAFNDVTQANGNVLSLSVADFRKSAEGIIDARTERVMNGLKRTKFALAFLAPKLAENETTEAFIQTELESIVAFLDKNKPESTSGPVLRKVSEVKISKLADLLLILAETSGEIPGSFTVSKEEFEAAYAAAATKAQEFGKDSLGQFRIQKAKTKGKKGAEATASTETTEATEAPEGSDEDGSEEDGQ